MSDERLRLDKWLWHARFFKTRSLAAKAVAGGGLRINKVPVTKPAAQVKPDDVLTFPLGRHVRVIRIVALGTRRGPAPEAQALYEDLAPPEHQPRPEPTPVPHRDPGSGRPTKKERRQTDRLREG